MSNEDVTVDGGAPAQSMHGGPLGDISKLIQQKAARALEVEPGGGPRTAPAREPTTLEKAGRAAAEKRPPAPPVEDAGDEPTTAAELEAAAAEAAAATKEGDADAPLAEDTDPAPAGKLSVNDVAKQLGVDPRRIYDDLEIPLKDGRGTITLAELKDVHRTVAEIEDDRDALSVDRQAFTADAVNTRRQMERGVHALAAVVGKQAVEPLLAMVREEQGKEVAAGRTAILERFPEWRDPAKYDEARNAMADHLSAFGITRADLEAETNPKRILYVHANMERDRRAAAAKAKLDAPAATTRQRSPSARTPAAAAGSRRVTAAKKRARDSGKAEDKNQAIAAVLARGKR